MGPPFGLAPPQLRTHSYATDVMSSSRHAIVMSSLHHLPVSVCHCQVIISPRQQEPELDVPGLSSRNYLLSWQPVVQHTT